MSNRNAISIYFAVQGIAIILWWLLLFLFPTSRSYFQMGESEATLLAFWLPDLLLLSFTSLVGSYFCYRRRDSTLLVLCLVCGAMSYASLYCLAFSLLTNRAWLNVILMIPAMLLSIICTLAVSPLSDHFFRPAKQAPTKWNLLKTSAQIIIIWSVILFVIPSLIVLIEQKAGLTQFAFPYQQIAASLLFVGCSALGLCSGFTMAWLGKGTPLPLDGPRQLVIKGPYAYVRNPMAVAGLGQGLAVGLWLGSASVLVYTLIGSWIWQYLVRPLEEDDLLRHFGSEYEAYRQTVRCWWPRFKAYNT